MAEAHPIRVLIVDDAPLYAKFIAAVVERVPGATVVGKAHDGPTALTTAAELQPDLITLDVEMPKLDGLEVLAEVKRSRPDTGVIMVSGLTAESAALTAEALKLGAFDFVVKPKSKEGQVKSLELLDAALRPQIEAFARSRKRMRDSFRLITRPVRTQQVGPAPAKKRVDLVLIASSTGGPAALREVLCRLPADFSVPIVIAQHMPPNFTRSLAESLSRDCALEVCEVTSGMPVQPKRVHLLPGGKQSSIVTRGNSWVFEVTHDSGDGSPRPSANILFESAAKCTGGRVLAIVLTGMGDDGRLGCEKLWPMGATIYAQDESSCVVYGMPRAIVEAQLVDEIVPLSQMGNRIVQCSVLKPKRSIVVPSSTAKS